MEGWACYFERQKNLVEPEKKRLEYSQTVGLDKYKRRCKVNTSHGAVADRFGISTGAAAVGPAAPAAASPVPVRMLKAPFLSLTIRHAHKRVGMDVLVQLFEKAQLPISIIGLAPCYPCGMMRVPNLFLHYLLSSLLLFPLESRSRLGPFGGDNQSTVDQSTIDSRKIRKTDEIGYGDYGERQLAGRLESTVPRKLLGEPGGFELN
ncbi:hypothetical protein AXG93_2953s1100 [Marchantia polymorpha subsp. ruderalis]|uniref:Uncharacterized protein n=1 Tax=Marchantia polymorpha subsp. ruderalis TaxID=1480154 RepID=A0A176WLN1_MARPO|nr:hypothetical protein AXG93_2953s1100 [Marchantia polymorpha subsp. ruderalis]